MTTPSSNSYSGRFQEKTLIGAGSLVKLLPTGTVFTFQFLSPLLTNNGHCNKTNYILSSLLICLCGISCFLSSFTDSYKSNGKSYYGIATLTGLWPRSSSGVDLSKYKLRFGDFVHAFFSLIVFMVLSMLDGNVVKCFYPSFESNGKKLLMALPPVVGAVSGFIFVVFPNTRHWVGYPHSTTNNSKTTTQESSVQKSGDENTNEGRSRV